jgi:hypothetical protein
VIAGAIIFIAFVLAIIAVPAGADKRKEILINNLDVTSNCIAWFVHELTIQGWVPLWSDLIVALPAARHLNIDRRNNMVRTFHISLESRIITRNTPGKTSPSGPSPEKVMVPSGVPMQNSIAGSPSIVVTRSMFLSILCTCDPPGAVMVRLLSGPTVGIDEIGCAHLPQSTK